MGVGGGLFEYSSRKICQCQRISVVVQYLASLDVQDILSAMWTEKRCPGQRIKVGNSASMGTELGHVGHCEVLLGTVESQADHGPECG